MKRSLRKSIKLITQKNFLWMLVACAAIFSFINIKVSLSQVNNTDDAHYHKQSFSLSKHNNLASSNNAANTDKKKKNIMIIATYPKPEVRLLAIWSQLECFSLGYAKIIISAPNEDWSRYALQNFTFQVMIYLPDIYKILEVQYYKNDRYDAGLWCDSLQSIQTNNMPSSSWPFGNYFLINDSLLAIRNFNDFSTILNENKSISLVSLNWWESNSTKWVGWQQNKTYWVESGARSFSQNGINVYYNKVCTNLQQTFNYCARYILNFRKSVRDGRYKFCIVNATEIVVAYHFNRGVKREDDDTVIGLYPGEVPSEYVTESNDHKMWANNYIYWRDVLVGKLKFPVMKITGPLLEMSNQSLATSSLRECTSRYISFQI